MSNYSKQFHIVAGKPVLKTNPRQTSRNASFDELAQEGVDSIPELEKVLKTATGRYGCKFETGPRKNRSRFNIKSVERGYQSPDENTDYCRAFLYPENAKQIIQLQEFFKPENNSAVRLYEDSISVPKAQSGLPRIKIKYKLQNDHIAEIQIVPKQFKKAFNASHKPYERENALIKRFSDPTSRPAPIQKMIDRYATERKQLNNNGHRKTAYLKDLIHQRDFFKVGDTPVMRVHEPFTRDTYTVVARNTEQGPMYVKDNSYLPRINNRDSDVRCIQRDLFVTSTINFAKEITNVPKLESIAS